MRTSVPIHKEILDIRDAPAHMLGDLNMSANGDFLFALVLFLNIPGFIVGYALGYQNQLTPCFEAKFGWVDG